MSFCIYPHKFDACHVHFGTATQNQTTENPDNKFYRMIYSTNHISLNSMGFVMHFIPIKTAHSIYSNKWVMYYDADHPTNASIIAQLHRIECSIIGKFMHSVLGESRQCIYSIAEHLNAGCIKTHAHHGDDDHSLENGFATNDETTDATGFQFSVTIFGIWETRTQCGIVYKFIKL